MPREWYQRLYLVLFVVFGSIYLLIPTFFWHPKGAGLTIGAETPVATPLASTEPSSIGGNSAGTMALVTPAPAAVSTMATGSAGTATATVAKTDDTPGWMSFFPKKRL